MFDYHVHTEFSVDCNVPMEQSCEAAIAAGITEIAFTDHVDYQPEDPGFGYYDHDRYFESLERVRSLYEPDLVVLAGAEIDFHSDLVDTVGRFVEQYGSTYDFVIGSIHYAAQGALIYPAYLAERPLATVIQEYVEQATVAARTGWFDTIGHLDLPKRYLPKEMRTYDPIDHRDTYEGLFDTLIECGVAFEINTSGIRQAPKASMPGPAVVRWYADRGGTRMTTGTDSHGARTVGNGIRETLEMLRLCGIDQVLSFRSRQSTPVDIDALLTAGSTS